MKEQNEGLIKVLGNRDVIALAFGAMIGWGWVVTTGLWITEAGALGAILAFIIGGILVLFVGLTYAELAAAIPLTGGELTYSFKAMGRVAAFITTWGIVLGYVSVVAFEAVALPTVFEHLIPNLKQIPLYTIAGYEVTATWAGIGIFGSILIAWINYRGIKFSTIMMSLFTLLIVVSGILLITGSSLAGNFENMTPLFENGTAGLFTVIIMTPFMFVGFNVIPQAAEEINLPQRRIGALLVLSVILAVVWYIAIIFGVSRVFSPGDMANMDGSRLVTAEAMAKAFGGSDFMGNILVLGGVGGILSSWIGFYVGGSRAIYALAKAGMLPKSLGELHPKYNTPYKAILLIGVLSTFSPLLGEPALVWLIDAGGLGLVVAWLMVAISFVILRKKEPNMVRPFRLKGGTTLGWIAIILSIGVTALYMPGMPSALGMHEWIIIGGWIILGFIFYSMSMAKFGKENSDAHLNKQFERVVERKPRD